MSSIANKIAAFMIECYYICTKYLYKWIGGYTLMTEFLCTCIQHFFLVAGYSVITLVM